MGRARNTNGSSCSPVDIKAASVAYAEQFTCGPRPAHSHPPRDAFRKTRFGEFAEFALLPEFAEADDRCADSVPSVDPRIRTTPPARRTRTAA